jgi:hypothetical protein
MLNLVQLQERLKDVPMQALMGYANGMNPQIPPFLALGELNRRKKMQEGAAAEQAKEMEGAPTIKEQIEQSTGLLALQGSRQRQAAQQQAGVQAAMPMAAPNTTTSEPAQLAGGGFIDDIVVPRDYQAGGMAQSMNPEMLKKLMMLKAMQQRRPGIAGIPVGPDMFKRSDFAGGGIVAFQTGGAASPIGVSPYEVDLEEMSPEERKRYFAERMKAREQAMGETRGARPTVTEIPELPKRSYAPPAAAKMGLGSIISKVGKFLGPLGITASELLFTSPEDLEKLRAADARKLREKEGLPQASYSNEGRAYERGKLDPTKEGPLASRPAGIETLVPIGAPSKPAGIATPKTTPELDFLRKIYNQADPDYLAELKKAGLDVRPQAGKALEELKRQREEIKGEDTFANRFLALTPGRRFGTGETGKGLVAYEKAQSDRLRQIGLSIAQAEDLEAKADYEFKRGNFDKANDLKKEAQNKKVDAAKSAGQIGVNLEQIAAQREGTAAQAAATAEARRGTNYIQIENARTRALAQGTRAIDAQIAQLQGLAAMGQQLTPPQQTILKGLLTKKAEIETEINRKYDALAASSNSESGGFRVIGVQPGAK